MSVLPDFISTWIFQETATGRYLSGTGHITPEFTALYTKPGWALTILPEGAVPPDPRTQNVDPTTKVVTAKVATPVIPVLDTWSKSNQLAADAAAAITKGFQSSALGSPHHYPSTQTDQLNLLFSPLVSCCDSNNVWAKVQHNPTQWAAVKATFTAKLDAVRVKLDAARSQVSTATTQADIDAVSLNITGVPQ